MTVTATSTVEAIPDGFSTWIDLSADVIAPIRCSYGIDGNGPTDVLAGTGTMAFDLRNSLRSSGGVIGYYSPSHADVRAGWGFGIPVRWVINYGTVKSITSITRSSSTATVTCTGHGRATGDYVTIRGATQTEYNGTFQITVTGVDTFTYTVPGTPATPATGTKTSQPAYIRFRGKIGELRPDPGLRGPRRCHVTCYDAMRDLVETSIREVDIQVDQPEDVLIDAILDALPADSQPWARSIEAGVDTYPYAFDDLGPGVKAAYLMRNVILSGLGAGYVQGDGTFIYKTRNTLAVVAPIAGFSNDMLELDVPSSLDGVYNHVRTIIHPKTIDAAATTVLWAQTGTAPVIAPAETITVWGTYRDPNNTLKLIGGIGRSVPITVTTDYLGNAQADGLGANLTADLSVVTSDFSSTVKFEITNNGAGDAYLTRLQIRGKGVYDNGPRTSESYTPMAYGDRPIEIDMPYQDDLSTGASLAIFVDAQFNDLTQQVRGVRFMASNSDTFMLNALTLEPTNAIAISETVTGLMSVVALIRRVELEWSIGGHLRCFFGLAPGPPFEFWQLGVVDASEIGETTILGA